MSTLALYHQNAHLYAFTATVLACTPTPDGHHAVILDQTAFFPEGGGQSPDVGRIGSFEVLDVQISGGVITHTLATPLTVGDVVDCQVDSDLRHRRMQNHSGEHIVSGLVHAKYGYNNVGFHLGDGDVTLDFDGVLTREQLDEIETLANRVVAQNLPVYAYYPDPAQLATLNYRSKLDLTQDVRIVQIGEGENLVDLCACCAPHVAATGEIGVIKLLDFAHYKGGVRIHMLCGMDALADYRKRYTQISSMAVGLSVAQDDLSQALDKLTATLAQQKQSILSLQNAIFELTLAQVPPTAGNLCIFDVTGNPDALRHLLNRAVSRCGGICGVFCGDDQRGYRYVIGRGRADINLRDHVKAINGGLSAKGGGSAEMLQGSATATREEIEAFFEGFEV